MPKAPSERKKKSFQDVFAPAPTHDHCKQVLLSKRVRDACFTAWEVSREPHFPEDKGAYYMACQKEQCPTTGKEHWQGVVCFNTVQPIGKIRGMLGQPTAYVGQRMGQLSDCIAYCTKDDTRVPDAEPIIKGKPRCLKQERGERSDLNRAREIIQQKRTWTEVINDRSLCDVMARHVKWCHEVFENRPAQPVDEATSLDAFAGWQHKVLHALGCDAAAVTPSEKVLWFHTSDSIKMLHLQCAGVARTLCFWVIVHICPIPGCAISSQPPREFLPVQPRRLQLPRTLRGRGRGAPVPIATPHPLLGRRALARVQHSRRSNDGRAADGQVRGAAAAPTVPCARRRVCGPPAASKARSDRGGDVPRQCGVTQFLKCCRVTLSCVVPHTAPYTVEQPHDSAISDRGWG